MKRLIIASLGVFALFASATLQAQNRELTEVYVKEHIPNQKGVPYTYTREADVMWSKVIWRMVDLRQKANMPLYFPTKPIGERMSLISALLEGIDNHVLTAYDASPRTSDYEFRGTLDTASLERKLGNVPSEQSGQLEGRKLEDIKMLYIKERWFFDRNYSTMKVQIVGLCPIRVFYREGDPQPQKTMVCWVYYPEARALLASKEIFNRHNDSQTISFDDFFMQRRFDSYIVAETNVYDNRNIESYQQGLHIFYESEKIKTSIFNFEQDLWEY